MRTTRHRRRITGVALALALAVIAGACGDDDTNAVPTTTAPDVTTTSTPDTTDTSAPPTSTPDEARAPVAEGSGCAPGAGELPDGRWYGLAESAEPGTISFDLACWYSGDDAAIAAAEDGKESPPPNDYYVRNDNTERRDVPVAEDVRVRWYPSGDPNSAETVSYDEWLDGRSSRDHQLAVWLEVRDSTVTSIEEQWVP